MEKDFPQIIIFLLLAFSFKNLQVDNLISVALAWEVAVPKCAIQWFYFGEEHASDLDVLLI